MTASYRTELNALGFREAVPKPSSDELAAHYAGKYYQNPQGSYAASYLPEEIAYFNNIARVAEATARRHGLENTLFDVGCGEGYFSQAFVGFGWAVSACDFSDFGVTRHNPSLLPGFTAGDLYGVIKARAAEGKQYGLVNLQNVLEHVLDPVQLLHDIKPLFARKAAVRLRVPNDYSAFQMALMARGDTGPTWFAPPEHLSYFDRQGLLNLLAHCGYRVLSVQTGFPIEVFLSNPHSNYAKDRSLGKGAHLARVFCENHLIEQGVEAYVDYAEAAGRIGFGRDLLAYAVPEG
jgi:SAM-dependent methyltransferase